MGVSINLPGWNDDPTDLFGGVLTDSDVDSPEGIWYGNVQQPCKVTRRGLARNMPGFMLNVDESGSPGATTHYHPQMGSLENHSAFSSASSPSGAEGGLLLAPLPRSLRSSISAPHLQRDDPVLQAVGTQQAINDFLADTGYSRDRYSDAASPACSASGKDVFSTMTHLADTADSPGTAQSSALFQRRSVQRDGNLSAPSPVNVSSSTEEHTAVDSNSGGGETTSNAVALDRGAGSNTSVESDRRSEAQRLRLLQLQQMQVSQEIAKMNKDKDLDSLQFRQLSSSSDASERVAKAAQAARMYGIEASSTRNVAMGPAGLVTPVTPQHPLPPVSPPQHNTTMMGNTYVLTQHPTGYGVPDLTLSPSSSQFQQQLPNQFHGLTLPHRPQQVFTPQFLHQNEATDLFVSDGSNGGLLLPSRAIQQATGGTTGYTSVYPSARHHSISSGHADRGMFGLTLTTGSDNSSMPRRASHAALLRSTESSPSLATVLAANPMQLQNPFSQLQQEQRMGLSSQHRPSPTLEPSKLMLGSTEGGLAGQGTVDPSNFLGLSVGPQSAAGIPRSAPADASKDTLSQMQQERMHQLQQQQLNFLKYQYNAKQSMPGASLASPLTPPRSPLKMKSTPHLKSPLASNSGLSSPGKPARPTLRKIASNKRISHSSSTVPASGSQPNSAGSSGSSNSATSLTSSSSLSSAIPSSPSMPSGFGVPPTGSPTVNKGFTMELLTSASPNRPRTFSDLNVVASSSLRLPMSSGVRSSKSSSSLSPSFANSSAGMDAALDRATGGFARLSFVNYGMDDADEICSAVAPSGSYKVPLRGYEGGSGSSGEEDHFDGRAPMRGNYTGSMMDSDNDDDTPKSAGLEPPSSPTKKLRKNPSKPNMASGSASPLRTKRSMANVGGGSKSSAELLRSPRKTKSSMLLLSPIGSGGGSA